jgi:hypothetical protein
MKFSGASDERQHPAALNEEVDSRQFTVDRERGKDNAETQRTPRNAEEVCDSYGEIG